MAAECRRRSKITTGAAAKRFDTEVLDLVAGPGELFHRSGGRNLDSKLLAILENNCFRCVRDPDYVALFVATSRFNHSCCPNAFVDCSRSWAIVRALQRISSGEEVCIAYVPIGDLLAERQLHFAGKGFACLCRRCANDAADDPQFKVLCGCGHGSFSAQPGAASTQTCAYCSTMFDKRASLEQLRRIEDMNAYMRTPEAASTNPIELIEVLRPVVEAAKGTRSPAPPGHPSTLQLLNNLANCYYFAATRVPGAHRTDSLTSFLDLKRRFLAAYAKNHGSGVNQRDVNYFLALYRMLMSEFPTEAQRVSCQKELEELCLLHFGEPSLPDGLSVLVGR